MTRFTKAATASTLALLMGQMAYADVTAQEVWSDWRDYMTDLGYEISATEDSAGDTLTIRDLSMRMAFPEDEGTLHMLWPEMSFRDQGDGTVAIGLPASQVWRIDLDASDEDPVSLDISFDQTGFTMVASGDPEDMTYSYSAALFEMALQELRIDGTAVDAANFTMAMENLSGLSSMALDGDIRSVDQRFDAEVLRYDVNFIDPEGGGNAVIKSTVDAFGFEGSATIPMNLENPEDLFAAGFAFGGQFSQGPSNAQMSAIDDGKPFSADFTTEGGDVVVAMDKGHVEYEGAPEGVTINLAGADIPFPISLSMEEVGFGLLMPLAASEEEQDFGLGVTLAGLAVPDMLWNLIDPASVLPRESATLAFDLSGKTRIFQDLMSPDIQDSDDFPGELIALSLDDLVVEIAGAELTGVGDFTFDNSDLESFDGMPKPLGALDLRLLGGNGLLDNLIKMGIVSEDDAMGARMMMGLFAVAGPGEDELNSRIEINEEGHVLANGQRIQ